MAVSGYESLIVIAFLDAHGERRDDDKFCLINDKRLTDWNREAIVRWEAAGPQHIIPLDYVDRLLMRHDFMTFELEDWAQKHYGRNGFVDPNADPVELVL